MSDHKRVGRAVGGMLLAQFVGIMIGYICLDALRSTDYMQTAAANAARIQTGLIVLIATCSLTVAISVVAWRAVREYSRPMGFGLIVLASLMFVVQVVDAVYVMSMVGLSQQQADGVNISAELASAARMTRRYVHYLELTSIDLWLAMLYATLLRFRLIPRLLAGFALLTVVVHFVFIPLAALLGYGINTTFGVAMAVGMVSVAGWLLFRGFGNHGQSRQRP